MGYSTMQPAPQPAQMPMQAQGMVGAPMQPQPAQQPLSEAQLALMALASLPNIVDKLPADKIEGVAQKVIEEYDIDKRSRAKWEERNAAAMDLAMLVSEEKSYPWSRAANIKFPLLTTAALQFNARAYPAIVQGNRVAKTITWGEDPDGAKAARGERVSEHLSYQLLDLPEWESDTDRGLLILSISGNFFRKVYYDPSLKRNTTRLLTADRFVVNYWTRSLEDAPRVTEQMWLYPYEIQERIRSGRFIEFDYENAPASTEADNGRKKIADQAPDNQDRDAPHLFLEQHRLLDLDEDGYPEPYIVTVHHSSQKVCRIVANWSEDSITVADDGKIAAIRKQQYYVKYGFVPSPDGGFYDTGFGWYLKDIQEAINAATNQMIDASTLANVQGGLVSSSLGIKDKKITLQPGEWKVVNTSGPIDQAVMPINYPGPNAAMFSLLEFLTGTAKELASIKDVLTGEGMGKNASPTTTLAMIEQGLQVFTAIYKRIHRSLKTELGMHAKLNKKHLTPEEYNRFFDDPQQQFDPKADYNEDDCDILPISDPNNVSKMQKLAKAQFVHDLIVEDNASPNPMLNKGEGYKRLFAAADIEEPEKLINPPPPPEEQAAQKQLMMRGAIAEVAVKESDAAQKQAAARLTHAQADAQPTKDAADIILTATQAGATQAQVEQESARLSMDADAAAMAANEQPQVDPMAQQQAADEMQRHNDQMALEHRKVDSSEALGLAKIQQAAEAAEAAAKAKASATA